MPLRKTLLAVALVGGPFCSSSCTLAKPVVCAFTTPIYALGGRGGGCCWCSCDGRAVLGGLLVLSAIGAVGGLVTGLISDFNALTDDVPDPTRNFHDPFATNTSEGSF